MDISETEKLKLYNADCMEVLPTLASECGLRDDGRSL